MGKLSAAAVKAGLAKVYQAKLASVTNLKQSILLRAFADVLTGTAPEAAA
ncbi:MAG: hypothetical protein IT553_02935 [Sphingomonadaceae bacterium]|nr:hypothetical protein [Sphingomonadaceae bacterium]